MVRRLLQQLEWIAVLRATDLHYVQHCVHFAANNVVRPFRLRVRARSLQRIPQTLPLRHAQFVLLRVEILGLDHLRLHSGCPGCVVLLLESVMHVDARGINL